MKPKMTSKIFEGGGIAMMILAIETIGTINLRSDISMVSKHDLLWMFVLILGVLFYAFSDKLWRKIK